MALGSKPQRSMQPRREGFLVSEYKVDRLNAEIKQLQAELEYVKRVLSSYREADKDRTAAEVAIFVVGLMIGVVIGWYA
jgi:F0F1-type ATP synthase assembly protein I